MMGNVMDCDCKLRWLIDFVFSIVVYVDKFEDIICKSLDWFYGCKVNIEFIKLKIRKCKKKWKKNLIINFKFYYFDIRSIFWFCS